MEEGKLQDLSFEGGGRADLKDVSLPKRIGAAGEVRSIPATGV